MPLGEVPDPAPARGIADRDAEEPRLPFARPGQAEQNLDGGRLVRAIRAEQAEQLATPDLQIQAIESPHGSASQPRSVYLAQTSSLDGQLIHAPCNGKVGTKFPGRGTNWHGLCSMLSSPPGGS